MRAGIAMAVALAAAFPLAANAEPQARIIDDMSGRTVRVPVDVTRVVGTGGAVDAWVLLLGSPEKLVATSPTIRDNPWFGRLFPAVRGLPVPLSGGDVNVEALLACRPHVAIMLSGMATIDKVVRAGIPTVVLERRDVRELMDAVSLAARVLGPREEEVATRYRAYFEANLARILARTAALPPERRLRVYYASSAPLTTEGAETLVTSWIETAGGRNVAARPGLVGMGRQVTLEDVLAWDPEVIITMRPAVRDEILASERWRDVSAVRHRRVLINPQSVYSWGIRSAEEAIQVLWAAWAIHPEVFADIDMVEETRRYHQIFYHVDLSDDDIARILTARPPADSP